MYPQHEIVSLQIQGQQTQEGRKWEDAEIRLEYQRNAAT